MNGSGWVIDKITSVQSFMYKTNFPTGRIYQWQDRH